MKRICALAAGLLLVCQGRPQGSQITVRAGGNLQAAINAARPGDVILLEPGATYVGPFVLPARAGSDRREITIETSGIPAVPEGQRMTPAAAASLAKLRSPDVEPALATAPGARFWRITLVEFLPNRGGFNDIITLGDGTNAQNSAARVPSDLVIDRVYIHGDPTAGQKRGIALNSTRTTISNSYISDIKAEGIDSQAICGWNGPGDYTIENNYLEAAGENILFGGADPAIDQLTPTHIVIRRNRLEHPSSWKGSRWTIKNLLELKNARDVTIEGNVFERNWAQAQSGFGIVLTGRNQDGKCTWCQVEDVKVTGNVFRDLAAGVNILGFDDGFPSRQTNHIVFRDNLFDGIDRRLWGGDGYLLQMVGNPMDIVFDHNTVILGDASGIVVAEPSIAGFAFTNNLTAIGQYGVLCSGKGTGDGAVQGCLPGATISGNVLAGADGETRVSGKGNLFPSVKEFQSQFVNFSRRDFRLKPGSAWLRGALDGGPFGATLPPGLHQLAFSGSGMP